MTRIRTIASLSAVSIALLATETHGQSASAWNEHPNSKVRLIAGEGRMLGIELQMALGWKTYWRMPGDAGVPPSFDWSQSKNLKKADVLYPAPETMVDASGVAVGYKGTVIFPVHVSLESDGKPAIVAVEFSFGVCREICIPVDTKLSLTLDGTAPWPPSTTLKAHLARVPAVAADVGKAAPLIRAIAQDVAGGKPRMSILTSDARDVYIEAPDGLFVPLSKHAGGGRFDVDLSASPDLKDLIGKPLRITATTANGGVETTYVLK